MRCHRSQEDSIDDDKRMHAAEACAPSTPRLSVCTEYPKKTRQSGAREVLSAGSCVSPQKHAGTYRMRPVGYAGCGEARGSPDTSATSEVEGSRASAAAGWRSEVRRD